MSQLYMMSFRHSFHGAEFPTRIELVFRRVRGIALPPFFEATGLEEYSLEADEVQKYVHPTWPVNDDSRAFAFLDDQENPIGVVVAAMVFLNEDDLEDNEPSGLSLWPLHLDPGFQPYVAEAYRKFIADFAASGERLPFEKATLEEP